MRGTPGRVTDAPQRPREIRRQAKSTRLSTLSENVTPQQFSDSVTPSRSSGAKGAGEEQRSQQRSDHHRPRVRQAHVKAPADATGEGQGEPGGGAERGAGLDPTGRETHSKDAHRGYSAVASLRNDVCKENESSAARTSQREPVPVLRMMRRQ